MQISAITAELKDFKEADDGMFEAILSMPTVDRDGEVVDAKAFEPLPDYIPIDIDHGMSVTTTVGSGTPFYDGDVLRFRGSFASTELGQEVRTLVTEGHIRKMSVAFMDAKREQDDEDGRMHIRRAELLNAAIVAIPSNREASILAAKAADVKATKGAALQHIHDLTVSAGAACDTKAADATTVNVHMPPGSNGQEVVDAIRSYERGLDDDTKNPADTDPETTAAPAAVEPPAEVLLAQVRAELALATLTLL